MPSTFFDKFRRVTASTQYLPEVDGLRFLAVFWVAILMHTTNYLDEKFYNSGLVGSGYWRWFILEGTHGMFLFFMISGFILSLPFAKTYLTKGPKVNIKRYYLRRLTRLEPPYIMALLLFFLVHVLVLNRYSLNELVPSFFASLFYSHDLIYNQHSLILPIAWSLEVEVQFYLLAPLLCAIFLIRQPWLRRSLFLLLIISGYIYCFYGIQHVSLPRFLHYFLAGMLLADLYVSKAGKTNDTTVGFLFGIAALLVLFAFPSRYTFWMSLGKLAILFTVFYLTLFNSRFKSLFCVRWMTLIGGMCYSIYLLHFGILSSFGTLLLSRTSSFPLSQAPFYLLGFTLLILLISAAYFYFIEKPFMQYNIKRLKQGGNER